MMTKMAPQQYCLRWKHHHTNVQSMFTQLLEKERFCDVTLYCSPSFTTQRTTEKNCSESANLKGVSLKAHRVVLAACSELLASLLGAHEAHGEPVLVIDGAEPRHVRALLDYMYTGEMNVHHSQLAGLLKTAEELRIKGLTDIRWNNKDEPPDDGGSVTATATHDKKQTEKTPERKSSPEPNKPHPESKPVPDAKRTPSPTGSVKSEVKSEGDRDERAYNGGPPPLIKLPSKKDKTSPLRVRRDLSDNESSSPKRRRLISGADNTDDDSTSQTKSEREQDWRHGNMQDISAERVGAWSDDEEWDAAPADIASFLHTRLKVDGDNSNDDDSTLEETAAPSVCSSLGADLPELRLELSNVTSLAHKMTAGAKSSKSGTVDSRFPDVVKLNDYLQHGRRPQFWEENYVRRVMEAVRTKELEMKQAAEILGVSYGTLYGRYRDVYGCINRPYSTPRAGRDVWIPKGPSEVLERLQRGEICIDSASAALGVNPQQLAAYVSSVAVDKSKEVESIPIDLDSPTKKKSTQAQTNVNLNHSIYLKNLRKLQTVSKQTAGSDDDDTNSNPGTATEQSSNTRGEATPPPGSNSGMWPTIRVANLDSLKSDRGSSPSSPSALMRTRPDLTILPASKQEHT